MDKEDIENRFTHHTPGTNQKIKYENIRYHAANLAHLINALCPDGREKSLAISRIEESVFWSNASIARNEKE